MDKYFHDFLLLQAFAMQNQAEFLIFVKIYIADMEEEGNLDYERENDEE